MTPDTAPNPRLRKAFIVTAFITFTLLLHVTFPNMGGTGLRMPHNAAVWMGFGVMMAIAMWPAARGVIRYSAFHKGLGLLLLALWLPFLWSWNEASLIALPRMLTVTAGAILLLGLAQLQLTRRDWWWIGMAILAGALLETAYGYGQLYLLEPGNWVGYDPASGRPYGVFQQVNVMASFLATGLVISAWLYGEARESKRERGVILLAPLFMPALILVIQSRTGWLAALVAVPLVLVHLWTLDRGRLRAWGGVLAAGCVLAAIVWWAPWAEAGGSTAKAVGNPGERLPIYLHSLRMIAEEPLTGWGYGRFQHDFLHSFADWRAALPINQPEIVEPIITQNYAHPHNELLYWGIEGGLLPMLAIVGFAIWIGRQLWARGPQGKKHLLTALLLPLALHAMTELPFYHSQAHWLVFVLLLGMVAGKCWQEKELENRYTFGVRTAGVLVPSVLMVFMATHLQSLWQVKIHVETKGRNPIALGQAINPLGIPHDIEYLSMNQQLEAAANLGIVGVIEDYLKWAEEYTNTHPIPSLYANMLESEALLGNNSSLFTQELNRLYPGFVEIKAAREKIARNPEIFPIQQ